MQAHIERVFADLLEPNRKLLFTAIYGHLHRSLRRQLLDHVNPWLTRVSAQASRIASQAVAGAGNPHSKGRALAYRRGLLDRIAKLLGLPVDVPNVEICHICTIMPVSAHPAGCKHQFCENCITAWLGQRRHQTCPVCRNRFTHVHPWYVPLLFVACRMFSTISKLRLQLYACIQASSGGGSRAMLRKWLRPRVN